jgi:hypothetical protein
MPHIGTVPAVHPRQEKRLPAKAPTGARDRYRIDAFYRRNVFLEQLRSLDTALPAAMTWQLF